MIFNGTNVDYGDIVGVQGSGEFSDLIRKFTGGGPLSHIAVVTSTEPFLQVTEAIDRVRTRSWEIRLAESQHMWVLKSPLSPVDRADAVRRCLSHCGDDYGWSNIFWQLLDAETKSKWFTEHLVNVSHDVICSEMAADAEKKLGLDARSATPNDFWGWWGIQKWPVFAMK